MTTNLPVKRKRAAVSYAEPDEFEFDSSFHSEDDAESYDPSHSVKGSRKKKVKKAAISKKPPKPFRFLDLPSELRNVIYELALVDPTDVNLVSKLRGYRRSVERNIVNNAFMPNILAVNKQIHDEASSILYQQRIKLEDTTALHAFLAGIGPSNRLLLTDITVRNWGCGVGTYKAMNGVSLTLLATCTNLKRLFFDCNIGHERTPRQLAIQIFRDGHHFFEDFGAANGKKDAAVDVLELHENNYNKSKRSHLGKAKLPEPEEFPEQFRGELRKLLGC